MNGREEMEMFYKDKIEDILNKSPELRGFFNSLVIEPSSAYEYIRIVRNFMLFIKKDIVNIGYDDFVSYLNSIKVTKNRNNTTSSYQIVTYSALKKFCHYCYTSEKIKRDYMKDIERPKAVQSQNTIDKRKNGYLSSTELIGYVENVRKNNVQGKKRHIAEKWKLRDWCIIQLFLTTGMRCGALRNLDVSDVDLKENKIYVTEKGNKYRELSIADGLEKCLQDWIRERNEIIGDKDCAALFVSSHRERMAAKSIARVVEKYARGIEGKHISPHKLRATFATLLYENTKDIMVVKELLNHSNVTTTQIYIRDNNDTSHIAANIMSKMTGI